jgi:hypothetical protein
MAADLTSDRSLPNRIHAWLEHGFAKRYFIANFTRGDKRAAATVGVKLGFSEYLGALAATALITSRMTAYAIAAHIPGISDVADRSLVHKLTRQLVGYGHAEFTTNKTNYRPAHI